MTTRDSTPPQTFDVPMNAHLAFGEEAIRGAQLDDLLARACSEVAGTLGVQFAKVLEYLPEERVLLVRAGHGWKKNVVGKARLKADLGSPAGYALQTGVATIANDLLKEQRFRIPDLLRRHGVVSAVNVIIRSGDFVYGVLEADSREPRAFDARDTQFLQGYANILASAIVQQRLVAEKTALSRRTELLLNELRHRTKNNNQLLLGLLRLKSAGQQQLESRQVLDDIARHVQVLCEIDDLIFFAGGEGRVDLGRYLVAVVNNFLKVDGLSSASLRLHTEVAEIEVDTRRAQALAMIVNEFVTNSLKYGLGEAGELTIVMRREAREAVVELNDNGPGLPEPLVEGLGMRLIRAMCESLDGKAIWPRGTGTKLRIVFPIEG